MEITDLLETKKILSVAAIDEGTVIDHIPSGKSILLLRLLKLENKGYQITLGLNLPSSRLKAKDLIKIKDWEMSPIEAAKIAIISPVATINIIHDYKVFHKFAVTLPATIEHTVSCPNPCCITNYEHSPCYFYVKPHKNEILLTCKYCEQSFYQSDIKNYTF